MIFALLAQANPSVPSAPRLLPACAEAGCTTLESVMDLFGNIALIVLGVSGVILLGVFVYGGLLYLTSRGDSGQVQKATKALTGAVVGIAIVFGAFTVIQFGVGALLNVPPEERIGGKFVVCNTAGSLNKSCAVGRTCIQDASTKKEVCAEGIEVLESTEDISIEDDTEEVDDLSGPSILEAGFESVPSP